MKGNNDHPRSPYIFRPLLGALAALCLIAGAGALLPSCNLFHRGGTDGPAQSPRDTVYPLGFRTDSFEVVEGSVRRGEIFTSLLSRLGMGGEDALALYSACDSVLDPRRLRVGDQFQAYYGGDTSGMTLRYFVYETSRTRRSVLRCTPPYRGWIVESEVRDSLTYHDITITSSLWADLTRAGASPYLAARLSEIYAWTVDFFALREGDRFRVVYNRKFSGGEMISVDTIYYASFLRDTTVLEAVRFDQGDGGNTYWSPDGQSLHRAFLKAPLQFTRISSGFSYGRLHPVYGDVRAHTGVDYAAPTGTPIVSVGDGTVTFKGWWGGGGNTIMIRHNSVYRTGYLHMSRYADVNVGDRVKQGQVIGYVGMSGTATGPHLDFRVWKNDTPVDPLHLESPPSDPLGEELLPELGRATSRWRRAADSLAVLEAELRPDGGDE